MDDEFDRPARERRTKREGRPPMRLYVTMVEYHWVKGAIPGDNRMRGRWVPTTSYQTNSGWNFLTKSCRRFLASLASISERMEKKGGGKI